MHEDLDDVRLIAQDIVGSPAHDEARPLAGDTLQGLAQHHEVLTASKHTRSAVSAHQGIVEEPGDLFIAFLQVTHIETAMLSHLLHQLTIVVSDAQNLGKSLTELATSTAELPSETYNHFLFHDKQNV